jgi:hypothetical protein
MTAIYVILMVAATVAAVYFIVTRTRRKRVENKIAAILGNLAVPNIPLDWANSEATPKGMRVIWNGTVFNNEEEKQFAFKCFDVGFENAFNSMKDRFPTWDFNPGYVNIGIVEATAKAEDGYDALIDKYGRKIGGAVIGTQDGYNMLTIIIPSQKSNGWSYPDFQMRIIRHEYEHFQEFRSDTQIFIEKSGQVPELPDVHPHWDYPEGVEEIPAPSKGVKGLVQRRAKIRCALEK